MDTQQIIENCERIISTVIRDFLVNGTEDDEITDLVFSTIETLDMLSVAVQNSDS